METLSKPCFGPLHKGANVPLLNFGRNQKACRSCKSSYNRTRYVKKGPELRANSIAWKRNNRDKAKQNDREWRLDNPEKLKATEAKYLSEIENQIWIVVKRKFTKAMRGLPILYKDHAQVIGCDKVGLWKHLDKILQKGMHRGNFGCDILKWGIGFIRPLQEFDLSTFEGQRLALGYSNLEPVWYTRSRSQTKLPSEIST